MAAPCPDLPCPPQPAPAQPFRRLWCLARGYFGSEDRRIALGLACAVLVFKLGQVAMQLRINLWQREIFDALERHDGTGFARHAALFLLLALGAMATAVGQLWAQQMLALRWRRWLVEHLQSHYVAGGTAWLLGLLPGSADNPDQRISENTRWATFMAVDLAIGLLHAVLMAVSFIGVLWGLSGSLGLPFGLALPGHLVFAAALYALAGGLITWAIGRPMVGINIARNQAESDHRFALLRQREHAEGVALLAGGADETRGLHAAFGRVLGVMHGLLRRERQLMWVGSGYGIIAWTLPTLLEAPRFFAGELTLGALMQTSQAFLEVAIALSFFQQAWPRIADWRSHVERVVALEDSLEAAAAARAASGIARREDAGAIALHGLALRSPEGAVLVAEATAELRAGERVLIQGESGAGKSTLFRAIGGLWPWGSGAIHTPPREAMMVLPQRPYLPLGTLKAALAYPAAADAFEEVAAAAALRRCDLGQLVARLSEAARWDAVLSLGEQQRLAFARLLLHRPRWVLMDEATSALDEASQAAMMALFEAELAGCALLSIGHRPGLELWHDRVL
ncbi:MAG TPA: ABC transporter ATP-binding protein/permease, partial [Crenalkalicoccus sp.]|nr:ABC transporter ATP-binding protein/permease [Crenalkalicoccus sp.]